MTREEVLAYRKAQDRKGVKMSVRIDRHATRIRRERIEERRAEYEHAQIQRRIDVISKAKETMGLGTEKFVRPQDLDKLDLS